MAATGNITMEVGHFYVKTFELQARMEACKARIEGMKAMNDLCRIKSEWPVYGQGDFNIIACELENLADELNAIWKKLTGKDADK